MRERSQRFVVPVAAFALGTTAGAFGYVALGLASLLLPMTLLFGQAMLSPGAPLAPHAS